MIRVAFITPGAYPVPSVMGGSVERVVEKVVPLVASGVDARLYGRTSRRLPSRELWNGVRCERFPASSKKAYFRAVCRRLESFRPHIIQVENRPRWVPVLRARFPYARIWLNLHSATFICPPYANAAVRNRCVEAADLVLVNSLFLSRFVAQRVPRAAAKIRINHLGVDGERFPDVLSPEGMAMRERERAVRGWQGRPIVVFVGRLIPQKGVHYLLEAMPALVAAVPNVLVAIVGGAQYGSRRRTAYVNKLRALARRWRSHVHFEPYVPHPHVHRWFGLADVAVVPSVGREAFGLVNVEAMASGVPVVATNAGGIEEIVLDGVTGRLVPVRKHALGNDLARALADVLLDEPKRLQFGRNGRERALRHFTWRHTADRWLKLVEEALR